jgi:hypothetical protein
MSNDVLRPMQSNNQSPKSVMHEVSGMRQ